MRPADFRLNSDGKTRWLSFFPLLNFDFISHGFVIKSKEQNPSTQVKRITLKKLIKRISAEEKHIIIPQQIHGNECLTIKKVDELKRRYKGDAILTDRKDIFLTVSVADCLPIFLVEPKRKVVGLIHAGWRGTLLGIAKETIRKAKEKFGCNPEDFTLLFGPAIQKCCYEISELMAILFDEDGMIRMPGEKPKLDLIYVNMKQFLNCGVKRKKIFATNDCTFCNKDMFHSFRRDGDKAGRMIAFIGIK
ncbi:MAG: peptidoglycan editing factor PgeF [candidate division Zixibacteria bacterium]|nr:peptidoglycan editing factor PgeF [candidate division Zixibacteria bacterium]